MICFKCKERGNEIKMNEGKDIQNNINYVCPKCNRIAIMKQDDILESKKEKIIDIKDKKEIIDIED